jgi:magnesium transporter
MSSMPIDIGEHLDAPIGRFLRRDFTPLRVGESVGAALSSLRAQGVGERLVYFYVTDAGGVLVGVIPTRRLLAADPATAVEALMVTEVAALPATATVGDACEMFVRRRYLALPVVDDGRRLLGIVDVGLFTGEIADLSERQSVQDLFQLIGVHAAEAVTPWRGFRDRVPWLSFNFCGGLIAAGLAGMYAELFEAAIVLALFMPVVLALAESVSVQSVSLTLQRLHGPAPTGRRFLGALWRELLTAGLLGLAGGGAVGAAAWAWKGRWPLAAAVGLAVMLSMITACLVGVALPTALRAMRRDPKVATGPIVLALADVATLLFYFNLAGMAL